MSFVLHFWRDLFNRAWLLMLSLRSVHCLPQKFFSVVFLFNSGLSIGLIPNCGLRMSSRFYRGLRCRILPSEDHFLLGLSRLLWRLGLSWLSFLLLPGFSFLLPRVSGSCSAISSLRDFFLHLRALKCSRCRLHGRSLYLTGVSFLFLLNVTLFLVLLLLFLKSPSSLALLDLFLALHSPDLSLSAFCLTLGFKSSAFLFPSALTLSLKLLELALLVFLLLGLGLLPLEALNAAVLLIDLKAL